jgi:hypothetical protein
LPVVIKVSPASEDLPLRAHRRMQRIPLSYSVASPNGRSKRNDGEDGLSAISLAVGFAAKLLSAFRLRNVPVIRYLVLPYIMM